MEYLEVLARNLGDEHRRQLAERPALAEMLPDMLARAESRWPGIAVERGAFIAHLAGSLRSDLSLEQALQRLRIEELYLSFACARGDEQAIAIFLSEFLRPAATSLLNLKLRENEREEILQLVQYRLLVSEESRPARILSFAAWAPLKSWLRATILNLALNQIRDRKRDLLFEASEYVEVPATTGNLELEHFKQLYQDEFKQCFRQAVLKLEPHQRNLLRLHYLAGMSIDRLAGIYNIHRATAARRLQRIRQILVEDTRDIMSARLGLSGPRLESILEIALSRLDVSIHDMLATVEWKEGV